MSLSVYLGWHVHPWEDLLALVERAERLGYDAAFVDGDVSMLGHRHDAPTLDGWTVTTALLAHTSRIRIGSLRLVHHWNAARLAQAVATAEHLVPGRLVFQISIGDFAADRRFGLPMPAARERVVWLDETLGALRALWRGEEVTRAGRYVQLEAARVRPTPPGGAIPITVAARRPGMLEVVAAHADVWDVNLPPVRKRVEQAATALATACERQGRDPASVPRSMLIFTRLETSGTAAKTEFRRLNPWFQDISDDEIEAALVVGPARHCRERLPELAAELGIERPVIDLSGLDRTRSELLLDALAPANCQVDAPS